MWISRKKWSVLEKRVADLEEKNQSQPKKRIDFTKNNEIEVGYRTSRFNNSPVVQVSFEIYESDWYLFQKTKFWEKFQNFLEETQNRSNQMSQQEKKDLLE